MVSFADETRTTQEEKYIPHVIEPSFGIGRIIYCVFEHCFKQRAEDAQRTYFAFPPAVAPVKTSLLPLISNPEMTGKINEISKCLMFCSVLAQLRFKQSIYLFTFCRKNLGQSRNLFQG